MLAAVWLMSANVGCLNAGAPAVANSACVVVVSAAMVAWACDPWPITTALLVSEAAEVLQVGQAIAVALPPRETAPPPVMGEVTGTVSEELTRAAFGTAPKLGSAPVLPRRTVLLPPTAVVPRAALVPSFRATPWVVEPALTAQVAPGTQDWPLTVVEVAARSALAIARNAGAVAVANSAWVVVVSAEMVETAWAPPPITTAFDVRVPPAVTLPEPAGVAHVPSPRQKVELEAEVPELRLPTGRLPVTPPPPEVARLTAVLRWLAGMLMVSAPRLVRVPSPESDTGA